MVLKEEEVKVLAKAKQDKWISLAIEDSNKLILHYYGDGTAAYLSLVSGLESEAQFELRKKHAISNQFLTEDLFKPLDNIWSAKGGSIKFDAKTDKLTETIKEVAQKTPVKNYLKDEWKDYLITDPNGLVFGEIDEKSELKTTQKHISSIKNMLIKGVNPEYVVFESDVKIGQDEKEPKKEYGKTEKTLLWIVDDAFYYRCQIEGETVTIIDQIANSFGHVPGRQNSSILDTRRNIKISPMWKQVELLDKYLKNNSVKEIYQFLHGYPIFWTYVSSEKCGACGGEGVLKGSDCKSCSGTGKVVKKDVSDGLFLKPPENDQAILAPNIAGYVQPDLETWREQRTELDWTKNLIFGSQWGTTIERKDNETATGRFIDIQPVNNKLNSYADIIEDVHEFILNLIGDHYAADSYEGASVNYGRRYLIETPDQVWEKYINAKEKQAPVITLNQLLDQYYESEYQRDEVLLRYYLKLMKIEPFIHNTVEEVGAMAIGQGEKGKKYYFSDWVSTKMISEIIETEVEKLRNELEDYVKQINEKDGNQISTQGTVG